MSVSRRWLMIGGAGVAAAGLFVWGGMVGALSDARVEGWAETRACVKDCPKPYFKAHYRYLLCEYARFGRPNGYMKFLLSGWEGDAGIAADRTKDGKPFPPPLPAWRALGENESAQVREGAAPRACPFLFDEGYGSERAYEGGAPIVDVGE